MSKGSKVKLVRLPQHILDEVDSEITRRNRGKKKKLLTFSEWARQAFREKLDHGKRSRRGPVKPAQPDNEDARCKHGRTFFEGCSTCDKEYDGLTLQSAKLFLTPNASEETAHEIPSEDERA